MVVTLVSLRWLSMASQLGIEIKVIWFDRHKLLGLNQDPIFQRYLKIFSWRSYLSHFSQWTGICHRHHVDFCGILSSHVTKIRLRLVWSQVILMRGHFMAALNNEKIWPVVSLLNWISCLIVCLKSLWWLLYSSILGVSIVVWVVE